MTTEADPMETMRLRYLERLSARKEAIQKTWEEVDRSGWDAGPVSDLFVHVHKLTGSGATFGFPAITESARPLEEGLKPYRDNGSAPPPETRSRLKEMLDALDQTLTEHLGLGNEKSAPEQMDPIVTAPGANRMICLLTGNPDLSKSLTAHLDPLGYRIFSQTEWLSNPPDAPAAAVLVDFDHENPEWMIGTIVESIKEKAQRPVPIIALSEQDTFATRISATRAGLDTFLTLPLDVERFLQILDDSIIEEKEAPYRILLLDDDEDFALFCTTVLQNEGMHVTSLDEPQRIMDVLSEDKPDLILLDLYLKDLLGSEIASVIRQKREHDDLPILFVSTESDPVRRMEALQSGGTSMLVKPLGAHDLVGSVLAQARRFRKLRSLMVRDGLTRLLNHTSIKEQIRMETARAQRSGRPLALAMIDLDNFKQVNDNWGHPTGDQVLVSMARILRNRLRGGDVLARYGGEEFAVLFPETTPEQARTILEEILDQFRKYTLEISDGKFSVTFSAGIAGIPGQETPDNLLLTADKILYQAKKSGKNRVFVGHPS